MINNTLRLSTSAKVLNKCRVIDYSYILYKQQLMSIIMRIMMLEFSKPCRMLTGCITGV